LALALTQVVQLRTAVQLLSGTSKLSVKVLGRELVSVTNPAPVLNWASVQDTPQLEALGACVKV
jgi:hypothetical protein